MSDEWVTKLMSLQRKKMWPNLNHDVICSIRNVVHTNETKLTWSREMRLNMYSFCVSNNLSQVHSSANRELILLAV
jgi:hypothetical protein